MGGSGVQRTLKFVKLLGDFGWRPVVLTGRTGRLEVTDKSLLSEIPQGIKVLRTRTFDTTNLPGILKYPGRFIGRKLLIPDAERLWQLAARKIAVDAIDTCSIDLIYTTSYPYSDHLLGLSLKRSMPEIPWVADFRDEWTNNPYLKDKPHNPFRMTIEKKMERRVLFKADRLVTNTPVMMDNFLKLSGVPRKKFSVIPNGYDRDDFAGLIPSSRSGKRFVMTYSGLLYGRRHPRTFFKALQQLIREGRISAEEIEVRLIGHYKSDVLSSDIRKFGLEKTVIIYPYMEHRKCVEQLAGSDVLLLIEGTGPGAEAFYTGKVFEYMAAGRPVLAIVPPDGAAAGLVRKTRIGKVCGFDSINDIMDGIWYLYSAWKKGTIDLSPNHEEIQKYERRNLTAKLAAVFDEAFDFIVSTHL